MGSNSIRTIAKAKELRIPVGVSNRHVHLSHHEVEVLFGKGYELTPYRSLSQPGQFAAEETVTLVGPKGVLSKVRILGPARELTQVEISRTDGFTLGIHPPVRLSGSIEGTPGITLVGKAGSITISQGVIVAKKSCSYVSKRCKGVQCERRRSTYCSSHIRSIDYFSRSRCSSKREIYP